MSDELKFPGPGGSADRDSLGEPLAGLIRNAYSPASLTDSNAYWAGLERRIMARVQAADAGDPGWWSVLAPWAKAGLVAAAAILVAATVINERITDSESQYAYESVVPVTAPTSSLSDALRSGSDKAADTDATLDYVLSH